MNINKRQVTKTVLSIVGGMAAGTVTALLIKQNVNPVKASEKAATFIGSFVIGSFVQDKIGGYIEESCDSVFDQIDILKNVSKQPENDEVTTDVEPTAEEE